MKTSMTNLFGKRFFVVDTEIKKDAYRPGITTMSLKDEKTGLCKFLMSVRLGADAGSISDCGISVNGVNDEGNFVAYMPIGKDDKVEDIKVAYGADLLKVADNLSVLAAQMTAEATAVDAMFEGITDAATEAAAE